MKLLKTLSAACLALAAALPAMAQTAAQSQSAAGTWPSSVLWLGGIAAFIGFIVGSVPFHQQDYGWKFDMKGAFLWAVAGAGVVGGLTLHGSTGHWLPALYAIGVGLVLAVVRLISIRPPRVPQKGDLAEGINRAQGATSAARFKEAQAMYKHASFHDGNFYATRSPRDFRFGDSGLTSDVASALAGGLARPGRETFDILLVLVRDLPGETDQPGVIVVRGGANLRQVKVESDGLTLPGCVSKIPSKTIAATVGYAWR